MEKEVHAAVRKCILDAEKKYNTSMDHIEGIEQAEEKLKGMEQRRDELIRNGHGTEFFTKFVEESRSFFNSMVRRSLEEESFYFDFGQWAEDIDSDIQNQNLSLISLPTYFDNMEPLSTGQIRQHGHGPPISVKSFIHILQANGRLEDLNKETETNNGKTNMWATYVAWGFAVTGMIVALGFLSRDFYTARTNFAIHIERDNISAPLPAVTVCANMPRMPLFSEFPTKEYPGTPLFGMSSLILRNTTSGRTINITFPDTAPQTGGFFEEVISGPNPEACRDMKKETSLRSDQSNLFQLGDFFDVKKLTDRKKVGKSLSTSMRCYWCVRVGASKKIVLPKGGHEDYGLVSPSYQMNFFQSKFAWACTTNLGHRDKQLRKMMVDQLRLHATALMERKVLDFGDYPPGNKNVDAFLSMDSGFGQDAQRWNGDYVEGLMVACNVYFYAGHFYPTQGNPDIRYRFEISNRSWVQTGRGPYFKTGIRAKKAKGLVGPGHTAVEKDLYTISNSHVLFQDPDKVGTSAFVPLSKKISHVEFDTNLFLDVERQNERGTIIYQVHPQEIGKLLSGSPVMSGFTVAVAYRSGLTEKISSVSTIGWSQYVTDVFEFIGLFTGVCVFTLLVAPAHSIVASDLTKKEDPQRS